MKVRTSLFDDDSDEDDKRDEINDGVADDDVNAVVVEEVDKGIMLTR